MMCVVDYLDHSTSLTEVINLPNRYSHALFTMWRHDQDKKAKEIERKKIEEAKRNGPAGLGDLHQMDEERKNQNKNG